MSGRKRKHTDMKADTSSASKIDRSNIHLQNREWLAPTAIEFYKAFPDIEDKLKEIDNTAALVGPFRKLRGETDAEGIELVMMDRMVTDLPEMQTFLKCSAGRYAFWRDSPEQKHPMVVFVDLKTVPEVTMIGNEVEHAILDFCDKSTQFGINAKSAKEAKLVVFPGATTAIFAEKQKMGRAAARQRRKSCIGGELGVGRVPLELDNMKNVYGPLSQLTSQTEMLLRCLKLVHIADEERKVGVLISQLYREAMQRVAEGYPGYALELGYLLFLGNQPTIFEPMCLILHGMYTRLGHFDFIEILKLTLEQREITNF